VAGVGLIAAEFVRLANVLLSRSCGNPALITYPPPVIPSDLSFGYLSAALKSPVKIPILDADLLLCSNHQVYGLCDGDSEAIPTIGPGSAISMLNSRDLPTCYLAGVAETQL
jgi:hypothetical protein